MLYPSIDSNTPHPRTENAEKTWGTLAQGSGMSIDDNKMGIFTTQYKCNYIKQNEPAIEGSVFDFLLSVSAHLLVENGGVLIACLSGCRRSNPQP